MSLSNLAGDLMKRALSLAAAAGLGILLLSSTASLAQGPARGEQCEPDVADASMYENCRLRKVRGTEVCRCAIVPPSRRVRAPAVQPMSSYASRTSSSSFSSSLSGTPAASIGLFGDRPHFDGGEKGGER